MPLVENFAPIMSRKLVLQFQDHFSREILEELSSHSAQASRHILLVEGDLAEEGGGGGTQYLNTVRKIGKYQNTVSTIDEIPIPHLWSVTFT